MDINLDKMTEIELEQLSNVLFDILLELVHELENIEQETLSLMGFV